MSELSPAARSVFESFNSKFDWVEDGVPGPQFSAIAAALRAAADQVLPADDLYARSCCEFIGESARASLLAIADELEAL